MTRADIAMRKSVHLPPRVLEKFLMRQRIRRVLLEMMRSLMLYLPLLRYAKNNTFM